jgi:hypothetical protein
VKKSNYNYGGYVGKQSVNIVKNNPNTFFSSSTKPLDPSGSSFEKQMLEHERQRKLSRISKLKDYSNSNP